MKTSSLIFCFSLMLINCLSLSLSGNIIINGDFNSGLSSWYMWTDIAQGASANFNVVDGKCTISNLTLSSQPYDWQIQFNQSFTADQINLLETDATYIIAFEASAESDNRPCNVYLGMDQNPWTPYVSENIMINIQPKTYYYKFVLDTIYPSVKFCFNIGQNSTPIKVDNIKLLKITAEEVFVDLGITYNGTGTPVICDLDRDGDLDILSGSKNGFNASFFRNDGLVFTEIELGIPLRFGERGDSPSVWGDYDNDGDIDAVKAGINQDDQFWLVLYRNDGNNIFHEIITDKQGIWMGTLAWGDYDNDGDLDIFLYGSHESSDDGEPVGILYRNDGDDTFTESNIAIEDARRGAIDLGDYNNDGYLDILTCGSNISGNIFSSILKNNGNNTFTNINAGLDRYFEGDVCWGDYDNDGDLDIFITGGDNSRYPNSKIYRNDRNNVFKDIGIDLPGEMNYFSTAEWGDYDNDGDLDVLSTINTIIRNDGDDKFTVLNVALDAQSPATWGDMDNDGDLDIVTEGKIFINTSIKGNSAPGIPNGLKARISGSQVVLSWNRSIDDNTPSWGLSYNVCVGSSPGICDILSPMSDTLMGYRRTITGIGNVGIDTFKIIKDLPVDTFYWSVQAIDQAWQSSGFSSVGAFEILPMYSFVTNPIEYSYSALFGDYDNDDDLDILTQDYDLIKVLRNDGSETLTDVKANIYFSYGNPFLWGDLDNDGYLDIINSDSVYKNNKGVNFTNTGNHFPTPLYLVNLGDYDADGDIDILARVSESNQDKTIIYRNDKNFHFTRIDLELVNSFIELLSWFDYDNDSDLDLLIIFGAYLNNTTKIFRNDGNNVFTDINTEITGLHSCSISFADYDSDRDFDVLIVGKDYDENYVTKVYRNDGNDIFTNINVSIRGYTSPFCTWGDYNNDGYIDIVISGYNNGRNRTKLYQNNHDGTFTEMDISIENNNYVRSSGDYEGDGDLDLYTSQGLFRNNSNPYKQKPLMLSNLKSDLKGLDCQLSWEMAKDEFGAGFSYNLKIGTSPNSCDIKSPKNVPGFGNVPTNTSWLIKGLEPGKYYWSVQAVDQTFNTGPWAVIDSFVMTRVSPDFSFDTVCFGQTTTFTDFSVTSDSIVKWIWDFGDGTTSNLQNPSHLYQTADTFDVTLWSYSLSGDSADRTRQVIVKSAPLAGFSVNTVCAGVKSLFTNTIVSNGLSILSWNWDFGDNETLEDSGSVQHLYATDGSYNVQLSVSADNGCNSSFSDYVSVGKIPSPVITYSYGGSVFCKGDSSIIQAIQVPQPSYTYRWYRNGDLQTNSMNTYTVLNAGEYKAEVTNTIGNCTSESLPENIFVYERPDTVTIQAVNYDPNTCSGAQPLTLTAMPNSELYQYRWYYNESLVSGAYSAEYSNYLKDGSYKVIVGSGQCEVSSQLLFLTFKPVPEKPEIYTMGPVVWILACSNDTAAEYKWYYNGTLLPEARKPLYVANKQTGYYHVRISDGGECYISSDTILIGDANKDAPSGDEEEVILFPNPNDGTFELYFQNNYTGECEVSVYDVLGKLIYSGRLNKTDYFFSNIIKLNNTGAGIYSIHLKMANKLITRQLIFN